MNRKKGGIAQWFFLLGLLLVDNPHTLVGAETLKEEPGQLWSFGLGPYFSTNLGSSAYLYQFSGTRHWEVDERAEIQLRTNAGLGNDGVAKWLATNIAGVYFPTRENIGPLVGAGLGLGVAGGSNVTTVFGFSGTLFTGVRFFRHSTTQLEVLLQYQSIFRQNGEGLPVIFGGQVSVLF